MSDSNNSIPQKIVEDFTLASNLEQLPNGQIITYLKDNLNPEQFSSALEFIQETITKSIILSLKSELKTEAENLLVQKDYQGFIDLLLGAVATDMTLSVIISSAMDLCLKVLVSQYNLK